MTSLEVFSQSSAEIKLPVRALLSMGRAINRLRLGEVPGVKPLPVYLLKPPVLHIFSDDSLQWHGLAVEIAAQATLALGCSVY